MLVSSGARGSEGSYGLTSAARAGAVAESGVGRHQVSHLTLSQGLVWHAHAAAGGSKHAQRTEQLGREASRRTRGIDLEHVHSAVVDRRLERLAGALALERLPLAAQLVPRLGALAQLAGAGRCRAGVGAQVVLGAMAPRAPWCARSSGTTQVPAAACPLPFAACLPSRPHLQARRQPLLAVHVIDVALLGVSQHLRAQAHVSFGCSNVRTTADGGGGGAGLPAPRTGSALPSAPAL